MEKSLYFKSYFSKSTKVSSVKCTLIITSTPCATEVPVTGKYYTVYDNIDCYTDV